MTTANQHSPDTPFAGPLDRRQHGREAQFGNSSIQQEALKTSTALPALYVPPQPCSTGREAPCNWDQIEEAWNANWHGPLLGWCSSSQEPSSPYSDLTPLSPPEGATPLHQHHSGDGSLSYLRDYPAAAAAVVQQQQRGAASYLQRRMHALHTTLQHWVKWWSHQQQQPHPTGTPPPSVNPSSRPRALAADASAAPAPAPGASGPPIRRSASAAAMPMPVSAAGGPMPEVPMPPLLPPPPAPVPSPSRATPVPPAPAPAAGDPRLEPQLGTWANRQYRLLDAVPEREPITGGSGSGSNSSISRNGTPFAGLPPLPPPPPTAEQLQQQALQALQQEQAMQQQQQQAAGGPHQPTQALAIAAAATAAPEPAAVARYSETLANEAAWRWRFTRRWHAEQSRVGEEVAAGGGDGGLDRLEEALEYLQAMGTDGKAVSMQIGNTSVRRIQRGTSNEFSMDGSLLTSGTLGGNGSTLGAGSLLLAGALMDEMPSGHSPSCSGAGGGGALAGSGSVGLPRILGRTTSGEMLQASREVASAHRRAAAVLQQQLDIERQAEQRVQESLSQGAPWLGSLMETVEVDEWGSFRFLLLRVRDSGAAGGYGAFGCERQRIVLRGHNYMSDGQLVEDVNRKAMALSRSHKVPFVPLSIMGGGVMEWRRDRDRTLHLHSGFVADVGLGVAAAAAGMGLLGQARGPTSAGDLLNLAAVLARQRFPPNYKIKVQ